MRKFLLIAAAQMLLPLTAGAQVLSAGAVREVCSQQTMGQFMYLLRQGRPGRDGEFLSNGQKVRVVDPAPRHAPPGSFRAEDMVVVEPVGGAQRGSILRRNLVESCNTVALERGRDWLLAGAGAEPVVPLAGADPGATVRQALPRGTKVRVIDQLGIWVQISAAGAEAGWVKIDQLHRDAVPALAAAPAPPVPLVERDECRIVVAGFRDLKQAQGHAAGVQQAPDLGIFETRRGEFVVSTEPVRQTLRDTVMADRRARGLLPADARCLAGSDLVARRSLTDSPALDQAMTALLGAFAAALAKDPAGEQPAAPKPAAPAVAARRPATAGGPAAPGPDRATSIRELQAAYRRLSAMLPQQPVASSQVNDNGHTRPIRVSYRIGPLDSKMDRPDDLCVLVSDVWVHQPKHFISDTRYYEASDGHLRTVIDLRYVSHLVVGKIPLNAMAVLGRRDGWGELISMHEVALAPDRRAQHPNSRTQMTWTFNGNVGPPERSRLGELTVPAHLRAKVEDELWKINMACLELFKETQSQRAAQIKELNR